MAMTFARGTAGAFFLTALALVVVRPASAAEPDASTAQQPADVWIDVDTSTGVIDTRPHDVDDGLAMIVAFHTPGLHVAGVSVQFGNASLAAAVPIARDIAQRFGPAGLGVYSGAASADDFGKETDATRALAEALRRGPLTILALGPVTNVATALKNDPSLAKNVRQIVVVAARRPGFPFSAPGRPELIFPDANFEKDVPAMQALLDSNVPIAFAGYESSSDVWLTRDDMQTLAKQSACGKWVADTSDYWLKRWEEKMKLPGFNPFDTLAVAWASDPQLLDAIDVTVHITSGPDDRAPGRSPATKPSKAYLIAEPARPGETTPYRYLTGVKPAFKPTLLKRLAGG